MSCEEVGSLGEECTEELKIGWKARGVSGQRHLSLMYSTSEVNTENSRTYEASSVKRIPSRHWLDRV
jgi:hypothetical protein